MNNIEWIPEMSLGVVIIDEEHKRFLHKFSELARAPDLEFSTCFLELLEELEHNFKQEEDLMEKCQFFQIREHRQEHGKLLHALHIVTPNVLRGEFDAARETLSILPKWFVFHLSKMDMQLAIWLKLKEPELNCEHDFYPPKRVSVHHSNLHVSVG